MSHWRTGADQVEGRPLAVDVPTPVVRVSPSCVAATTGLAAIPSCRRLTSGARSDRANVPTSYGVLEAGSRSGNSKRGKIMGVRKAVTSAIRSPRKATTSSAIGR
jgi:hypothetical protein